MPTQDKYHVFEWYGPEYEIYHFLIPPPLLEEVEVLAEHCNNNNINYSLSKAPTEYYGNYDYKFVVLGINYPYDNKDILEIFKI